VNHIPYPIDNHPIAKHLFSYLEDYDDLMDSVTMIADMGCGPGNDIFHFANLKTPEGTSRNIKCLGIDKDIKQFRPGTPRNLKLIQADFETVKLPQNADIIWSFDALSYTPSPLTALRNFANNLHDSGMLFITVPQYTSIVDNRLITVCLDNTLHDFNICNLIYMLALAGFDTQDGFYYKQPNIPFITAAVYKSEAGPLDTTTNWYNLMEQGLLPRFVAECVNAFGYPIAQKIILKWLDGRLIDFSQV
jgi:SAM-dependent methyltransferase